MHRLYQAVAVPFSSRLSRCLFACHGLGKSAFGLVKWTYKKHVEEKLEDGKGKKANFS